MVLHRITTDTTINATNTTINSITTTSAIANITAVVVTDPVMQKSLCLLSLVHHSIIEVVSVDLQCLILVGAVSVSFIIKP